MDGQRLKTGTKNIKFPVNHIQESIIVIIG
jgi:hypothetical protein